MQIAGGRRRKAKTRGRGSFLHLQTMLKQISNCRSHPRRIRRSWWSRIDRGHRNYVPLRKSQKEQHDDVDQRNQHQYGKKWAKPGLLEDEPVRNYEQERSDQREQAEERKEQ